MNAGLSPDTYWKFGTHLGHIRPKGRPVER